MGEGKWVGGGSQEWDKGKINDTKDKTFTMGAFKKKKKNKKQKYYDVAYVLKPTKVKIKNK